MPIEYSDFIIELGSMQSVFEKLAEFLAGRTFRQKNGKPLRLTGCRARAIINRFVFYFDPIKTGGVIGYVPI